MCMETVWIYWIRFKFFVHIPKKILSKCDKSKVEFLHLHTTEEILKRNKRQNDPIALFPVTLQTHIHKTRQLTNKICYMFRIELFVTSGILLAVNSLPLHPRLRMCSVRGPRKWE